MTAGPAVLEAGHVIAPVRVASVSDTGPEDWDRITVHARGGHVMQGRPWAEHRVAQGWRPRFVHFDDGRAALVLTRVQRPIPGFIAYTPRGPVAAGDPPVQVAERACALADWLRREGGTSLFVDPELAASAEYDARLGARGFHVSEEIQPARHRLVLPFVPGMSEEELFRSVAKATRQRVRAAEKSGTVVHEDSAGEHFAAFGAMLQATADRKSFYVGHVGAAARWWRRAIDAGQARFWVAVHDGQLLGGLLVYLQGGHYATAYSADDVALRSSHPGTMHLLRWTAIREAHRAGVPEIDLGGVDVPGARRVPRPGEACWGLYEHKTSFGAAWVESAPAHEIVVRPWIHAAGRLARAAYRMGTRRVGRYPGSGKVRD